MFRWFKVKNKIMFGNNKFAGRSVDNRFKKSRLYLINDNNVRNETI